MRLSRLDTANLPSEHWEHAHSPSFAGVLSSAYGYLALGQFDEAEHLVTPYVTWPMSVAQRLRLLFILAASAQDHQDYKQAIAFIEEAMALCVALDGRAEFAQLALLGAEAHHNLQRFANAAFIAGEGLSAWLDLKVSNNPTDLNLEIDLRDRYSLELFLLGRYEDALTQSYRAFTLAKSQPATRQTALRAAGLDWTIALLQRWRGNYKLAQQHILSSLAIYERLGSPNELSRLRIVAADITLDMLVPLGVGIPYHYREDLIQLAHLYITQALNAITVDPAAKCMGLLAKARFSRTLSMNEGRFTQLESLGHVAEQLYDLPLLAQVYTALGDEFGAAGKAETESQLNCYRRALGVVEASQAPAYSVWPRRALLRQEEFQNCG
jgi:tetratricopeptide (TPR) repeat protein